MGGSPCYRSPDRPAMLLAHLGGDWLKFRIINQVGCFTEVIDNIIELIDLGFITVDKFLVGSTNDGHRRMSVAANIPRQMPIKGLTCEAVVAVTKYIDQTFPIDFRVVWRNH